MNDSPTVGDLYTIGSRVFYERNPSSITGVYWVSQGKVPGCGSFDFGFGPPASPERLAMAGRDCGFQIENMVEGIRFIVKAHGAGFTA